MEKIKAKKTVIISMVAFWGIFCLILLFHSLTGTAGLRLDYSISKYVGLSFPSAILFLLTNVFVSVALWRYLMPRLKTDAQKIIMKIIVATLVMLSLFPIGLFDNIIPGPVILGRTPISFLHVITSRTMFVAISAFALLTFYEGKSKNLHDVNIQKTALAFFLYAAICIFVFIFFSTFFWQFDIIFESLYIALFFIVVLAF